MRGFQTPILSHPFGFLLLSLSLVCLPAVGQQLAQPSAAELTHSLLATSVLEIEAPSASSSSFFGETPLLPPALKASSDPWFGFDKVQHLVFSGLLTINTQYVLETKADWTRNDALPASISTAFLIGFGKEVYDRHLGPRRVFSSRDLLADSVGIALAVGLILL